MVTASGCKCSGYSNAHGFGRFCHPWEDPMQDAWCYVSNCTSAGARGSFGRQYESCDVSPPDDFGGAPTDPYSETASVLKPASGCRCSGFSSSLGYGASCKGWEYEGQTPWCYVEAGCGLSGDDADTRWARTGNGSFGHAYEDCVWRASDEPQPSPAGRRLQVTAGRVDGAVAETVGRRRDGAWRRRMAAGGRRLQSGSSRSSRAQTSRLASLLASSPESERFVALVSEASGTFLTVEPPPHKEALLLSARSDELSIRSIFSTFERTKLILSLGTNSLLNVCDEATGEVCTGVRTHRSENLKLLRGPRRTARWSVEIQS